MPKKTRLCFLHVFVVFGPCPGQAIQKELSSEAIIAWEGKMRAAGLMLPVQELTAVFPRMFGRKKSTRNGCYNTWHGQISGRKWKEALKCGAVLECQSLFHLFFFQRWGGWLGSENGTWISIVSCWKWAHLSSFRSPVQWWKLLPNEMSRTKFGKTWEKTTTSEGFWLHCCKNAETLKDWRHKSQWKQCDAMTWTQTVFAHRTLL